MTRPKIIMKTVLAIVVGLVLTSNSLAQTFETADSNTPVVA